MEAVMYTMPYMEALFNLYMGKQWVTNGGSAVKKNAIIDNDERYTLKLCKAANPENPTFSVFERKPNVPLGHVMDIVFHQGKSGNVVKVSFPEHLVHDDILDSHVIFWHKELVRHNNLLPPGKQAALFFPLVSGTTY